MTTPASVKIVGTDYAVTQEQDLFISDGNVLDGQIDYNQCKIRLNMNSDPQRVHRVLFHEIIHGIAHVFNVGISEEDVDRIANGLYQVYRDNPDLF